MGIEHKVSFPYHPQTDGQSERKNKTIISIFITEKAKGINWVKVIPRVQIQVNARISKPRKNSPFFSLYGFNSKLVALLLPYPIPIYSNPIQIHYQLGSNLIEAKLQQITPANKSRRPATPYEKEDQVMVSTKNFPQHFNTTKLYYSWIGPVKVLQANNQRQTYTLDLSDYPELSRITTVFHISLLKPYLPNNDNKFPSRKLDQPGLVKKGRWEVD